MAQTKWSMALTSLLMLMAAGLVWGVLRQSPAADGPAPKKALPEAAAPLRELARANSDFALDLYAQLGSEKKGENLFFSPYSISGAFALVIEGARGETAGEIGQVLRYPDALRSDDSALPWNTARLHTSLAALNHHLSRGSQPASRAEREKLDSLRKELAGANADVDRLQRRNQWDQVEAAAEKGGKIAAQINQLQAQHDQYELRIANALWGEKTYPFRQAYLDTLHKHYQTGGLFPVDFRNDFEDARLKINAWVEKQTNQRIKNMLPRNVLDEEAKKLVRLILTNAIYFRWHLREILC